jgi:hypothetical protein
MVLFPFSSKSKIDSDRELTILNALTFQATAEQLLLRNAQQQQIVKQQQQQPSQQQQQASTLMATTVQLQQPIIVQQLQQQPIQTQQLVGQKTIPISGANLVPQGQTAVVVNISQNSAITSASPVQIRNYVHRPVVSIISLSLCLPEFSSIGT